MELHEFKKPKGRLSVRRVGRGGKRGKTSGRGGKGQTARAGNKRRPEWRDTIKKIPKRRGFGKNRGRTVIPRVGAVPMRFATLSKHFVDGETVSPKTLVRKGLVRRVGGKVPEVKLLGSEVLTKKLVFANVSMSASAKEVVTKAGGRVK